MATTVNTGVGDASAGKGADIQSAVEMLGLEAANECVKKAAAVSASTEGGVDESEPPQIF